MLESNSLTVNVGIVLQAALEVASFERVMVEPDSGDALWNVKHGFRLRVLTPSPTSSRPVLPPLTQNTDFHFLNKGNYSSDKLFADYLYKSWCLHL